MRIIIIYYSQTIQKEDVSVYIHEMPDCHDAIYIDSSFIVSVLFVCLFFHFLGNEKADFQKSLYRSFNTLMFEKCMLPIGNLFEGSNKKVCCCVCCVVYFSMSCSVVETRVSLSSFLREKER